jgi:centriolar protein POC1
LQFSPNGNALASVGKDETLRFWEVNFDTERETAVVKAHTSRIRGLSYSCDGLLLATCGDDKLVKFWSTQDRRLQSTLKGHNYWVRSCQFSPTAVNLASCDDKSVIIWDSETKKQIQ